LNQIIRRRAVAAAELLRAHSDFRFAAGYSLKDATFCRSVKAED
jgi:hypothetical protein